MPQHRNGGRPPFAGRTLDGLPPYDGPAMRTYLAARAIPGVETVDAAGCYWRTVRLGEARGWLAVGLDEAAPAGSSDAAPLRLEVSEGLRPVLEPLVARVRRLLDLDADPRAIAAALGRDPTLAPLVARRPGLRLPGAVDGFEIAVRAILGQQVTVRGASTLAGRLVELTAEPLDERPTGPDGRPLPLTHLPPAAERLAEIRPETLAGIGLPRARAATIVGLARSVADGELPELTGDPAGADPEDLVRRLTALPGIGPWTATYVAMRALPWVDAFPEADLGLRKAMGGLTPARLRAAAERWRPWRAYAAQHLWASLGDSTATSG